MVAATKCLESIIESSKFVWNGKTYRVTEPVSNPNHYPKRMV